MGAPMLVKFVEICNDHELPAFQVIETATISYFAEIECKFKSLVDSNKQLKQIAVYWDVASMMIAYEAVRDSHRPRELICLHRGMVEQKATQVLPHEASGE
jgi:hypothetical protein